MTLYDFLIDHGGAVCSTIFPAYGLEGSKTAMIIGSQVYLSPAMYRLYLAECNDSHAWKHLTQNIHCRIFGQSQIINKETLKEAVL